MRTFEALIRSALVFTCVIPFLFSQTVDFGEKGRPGLGEPGKAGLVVVAGAGFLAGPASGAPPLEDPPRFNAPVTYYRLQANQFVLVKITAGNERWGWMRSRDLLLSRNCLTVSKEDPTYEKVTLKNDWKADDPAKGGGRLPQIVEFLDAPGPSGKTRKSTRISEIFHVFAKDTIGANTFLLLGADYTWEPLRPDASILGWVPEAQCTRWNSRLGVYYNQANRGQRERVIIYQDLKGAQSAAEGAGGAVLAQESAASRALTYSQNRFPVVEQKDAFLKVAFIASSDAPQIEKARATILNLRNVQILFVIDATASMQPYFAAVQRAIQESVSSVPPNVRAEYHFAAAVYRDYADGAQAAEVIANFDDQNGLNRLGSVIARSNPADHDYPEAVYGGIIEAVKKAKWDPGSLKIVVVIGDHGNHPTTEEAGRFSIQDEIEGHGNTAKSVADAIDPADGTLKTGPILFHAINVNVRRAWIAYNDLFTAQMNTILDQTKHGGPDRGTRHGMGSVARLSADDSTDAAQAKDQVKKAIQAAFNDANTSAPEILNHVVDTGSCGPSASGDSDVFFGTQACSFLLDSVKQRGWIPSEAGYSQISEEGWLLSRKGDEELVEPWVRMSRKEAYSFTGFLSGLLDSSDHPERAAELIAQSLNRITGDKMNDGESLADYMKRAFQVPFRDDTILRYTPKQLETKLQNDKSFQEQFSKEIGRSFERLSLAMAEQKADVDLTWDQQVGRWLRSEKIPAEKRWASSVGVEQYGWFPLSYFPGGLK